MQAEKIKRRALTMEQQIKLADWMRAKWPQFEGRSDSEVREAAQEELGFQISGSSVVSVCAALGIDRCKSKPAAVADVGVSREDFYTLLKEVRSMATDLSIKSDAIQNLIYKYSPPL